MVGKGSMATTRTPNASHPACLRRRPLLEHFRDGFLNHLLILIAVVIQAVLSHSTPDQTLILRVIQVHDHRSYYILLGRNAAHAAPDPAHAPRAIGGLLFQPAIGGDDEVGILAFFHLLQSLALECRVDVLHR